MNKLVWCVNVLLVLFAVTATLAALHNDPGKLAPAPTPGRQRPDVPLRATPAPAAGLPQADLGKADLLWQASLFRPDRAEEGDPAAGAIGAAFGGVSDMELIGIGMVGGEAAAIIAIGDKEVVPVRLTKPGRVPGAGPARKTAPHVFRLGQEVADSGFEVKSIEMDKVVLARGDEERELKVDRLDTGSRRRTELAAREALTRPPPAAMLPPPTPVPTAVAANTPSGAVPPPPPPPGTNAAGAGVTRSGVVPMSREERVQAALRARRLIMETRGLKEP